MRQSGQKNELSDKIFEHVFQLCEFDDSDLKTSKNVGLRHFHLFFFYLQVTSNAEGYGLDDMVDYMREWIQDKPGGWEQTASDQRGREGGSRGQSV